LPNFSDCKYKFLWMCSCFRSWC